MSSSKRIIFAGTPDFAKPTLQSLLGADVNLVGVYTQPDRPAGRGRKQAVSSVKQCALAHQCLVRQPKLLNQAEELKILQSLQPDLIVVVAYGLILPQPVLDIATLGCINLHASLLPRWRGAAPIQRAIEAGDTTTGVTLMQMDAKLDHGDILAIAELSIETGDTTGTLYDKLAHLAADLLKNNLTRILSESLPSTPQDKQGVTYANKLCKQEAPLNWQQDAITLTRKVRAFSPWPVATACLDGQILRIFNAHTEPKLTDYHPGEIVAVDKKGIAVATHDGLFVIDRLQKAGSRVMTAADFVNGVHVCPGQRFEHV